eukprot:CAMPEP_0182809924 /NCGR_PEP_ID=MMETSP0006_2-20121128/7451_1 /TAXON_ID=97485 /ORGANISM="Prymnesium parvum, Strain Texoma1" /LENGTH=58 /DNA_ID=CAMNT_0024935757 /DNA_START=396 /DNA_END=572 /DNA_ORIENTATION=+
MSTTGRRLAPRGLLCEVDMQQLHSHQQPDRHRCLGSKCAEALWRRRHRASLAVGTPLG